ncbi:hypothetical protein E0Z10_g7417 [Xylaria hypoxylon]|uniref:Peptide transporter PTR2 n=1 Tax=Xylaria hypoxylon TaxID=37992 RepID=A0A4Z0YSB1_9PEZI|nr:hypothetical protein E0Z10_g7417 [Xylaria hypoxylon]
MAANTLGAENVVGLNVHHDAVEPATTGFLDAEKGATTAQAASKHGTAESQVDSLETSSQVVDLEAYPPPTEEERKTLRKVFDTVPWTAWTLCLVEASERASYYGVKAVFNNFLQFPLPEGGNGAGAVDPNKPNGHAGALGRRSSDSFRIDSLVHLLGLRYPHLRCLVGGHQVGGAAPALLQAGKGAAPFLVSFFLLAIGAGIFKPNIAPTLIDQYKYQREYTKVLKSGEKVLVDPETTISHILLIFYAFVNVGAFFSIAVVYIEKYRGFWLAFLAPGIIYFLLPLLLAVTKATFFSKNLWHNVKPSTLAERGTVVSYSEKDVNDVQRTWEAVQIFLYIPIWNLNDGGVGSVQSNQGAAMTTNGAPNDLLNHFNPLTIIVVSPFLAQFVYPYLQRKGIKFGRIDRMTFGFVLAIISGVIGAIVQYRVYETSPCGYEASTCDDVSPISIWWQIPNVSLGAISEIFVNVTAYELAYARAPENMRATVVSLFLFMTALSSALGEILIPAINDPTLVWAWAAPAIALFVQTILFVWRHRHVNEEVFMTYKEDFESVHSDKKVDETTAGESNVDEKKEG